MQGHVNTLEFQVNLFHLHARLARVTVLWVFSTGHLIRWMPSKGSWKCSHTGSLALVLMGDFDLPDSHWRNNTRHKQSRRFLEIFDNFLIQVMVEPSRKGVLLDLILTDKESLVGDMNFRCSLG